MPEPNVRIKKTADEIYLNNYCLAAAVKADEVELLGGASKPAVAKPKVIEEVVEEVIEDPDVAIFVAEDVEED